MKRNLTLLEVVVAMVLLGMILTGVFQMLKGSLVKHSEVKAIHQRVLTWELFELRTGNFLSALESQQEGKALWIDKHGESRGSALFFTSLIAVDRDPAFCGALDAELFLNGKGELLLVLRAPTKAKREEVLLNDVNGVNFEGFDPELGVWTQTWPKKKGEIPPMLRIKIEFKNKEKLNSYFFLSSNAEPIEYSS